MANISKEERARRQAEAQKAPTSPQLVRMVRGPEYPRPHMADVHPDEIDNYAKGGWQVKAE